MESFLEGGGYILGKEALSSGERLSRLVFPDVSAHFFPT